MFAVFTRILKDKKFSLIAYMLGAVATIEMYIALFPTIRDQANELNKLMETMPKGLMEAFGFESTTALFSQLEAFMSTEYYSFFWPIMVVTMVIAFANMMMVTEIEKGTIEITLAQPISRTKLFFTRYLAGVTYFLIFNAITTFSMIPLAKIQDISYQVENYYTVFGVSTLFGLAIFSMATFFSSIFSEKGKATAVSAAILLSMYVANIVASLKDSLESIKYVSFFYYFNPNTVFANNQIVDWSIPVFVGTIAVFTLAAAFWFNRRDVAA